MLPDKKVCIDCNEEKPIEEFYVFQGKYTSSYCKRCMKVRWKRRRANPETRLRDNQHMRDYLKMRRLNDPEFREREREYYRAYYRSHPKKCCNVLIKHHNDLKDDPERLTTAFIKKMSRCSCNIEVGIDENNAESI